MLYTLSDIHAHVVFDVDDGSIDLDMSLELLRIAWQEGIRDMVCASHSWGELENYSANYHALKKAAAAAGIGINLYPGCEVHCRKQSLPHVISALNSDAFPSINHTPYVLLEYSPNDSVNDIILCTKLLQQNTDKRFIIAHVERYRQLSKDIVAIQHLLNTDCLVQVNAYSFADERHPETRKAAQRLLKERVITLLGSDCHRTNHRPPAVQNGLRYVYEHCDKAYAQSICTENAQRLLFKKNAV